MYLQSPFPPLPALPSTNFHNLLFCRPDQANWDDHVMYIDGITGEKRTKTQFLERVYDAATAVGTAVSDGGLGLTDRDMVGILSENCLDYIVLVQALLAITVPFALFPSHPTALELDHVTKVSKVTHIFVHANLLPNALSTLLDGGIPQDRIYILEGVSSGRKTLSTMIDHVRNSSMTRYPVIEPKKDALAYLVFSSGTSGLPKAVAISHDNLCCAIFQASGVAQAVLGISPPPNTETIPVNLSILPFYHSYGFHFTMLRNLTPATFVIFPRWDIDLALEAISKYRVTTIALVPSLIHQLANSEKFKKADLSSVVSILSGAAFLPPQLAEKFTSLTKQVTSLTEGYGMSEGTIGAMVKPVPGLLGGRVDPLPGCTGILIPGMEARVVREDGSEADFDEPGELLLRGGNIALGYWGNEQATRDTFLPYGWLRTGDRFRVTRNGIFFFEDRGKDTLKVSGHQVSPSEIEVVLLAHPEMLIVDASVAGVAGGRTVDEKVPRAWVVLSEEGKRLGEGVVRRRLRAWTQNNLSKYKWLRGGIEFVDVIPKSPTGKVLRRVLQHRHAQTVASAAKPKL